MENQKRKRKVRKYFQCECCKDYSSKLVNSDNYNETCENCGLILTKHSEISSNKYKKSIKEKAKEKSLKNEPKKFLSKKLKRNSIKSNNSKKNNKKIKTKDKVNSSATTNPNDLIFSSGSSIEININLHNNSEIRNENIENNLNAENSIFEPLSEREGDRILRRNRNNIITNAEHILGDFQFEYPTERNVSSNNINYINSPQRRNSLTLSLQDFSIFGLGVISYIFSNNYERRNIFENDHLHHQSNNNFGIIDAFGIIPISPLNIENNTHPATSETVLKNLKKFKMNKNYYKKNSKGETEKPNCCICISEIKNSQKTVLLPCEHMFHWNCCHTWLKQKNTCPVCRLELN